STDFYVEARRRGTPWSRGLPVPVPVVSQATVTDLNSQQNYITRFAYRDGYYSGPDRQFRGFEHVAQSECGDETAPTKVSFFRFDVGQAEESLKGKMRQVEVFASPTPADCDAGTRPEVGGLFTREVLDYTTRTLYEGTNGQSVRFSFNSIKNTYVFERTD